MAVSNVPNSSKALLLTGGVDFENDTIRAALFNDTIAFDFDPDAHEFVGDVLDGNEAAEFGSDGGTGYSRTTLSSVAVTSNDTDDTGETDANDLSWDSLDGETIQGVVVYKEITDDSDSPVLFVIDDADTDQLPLPTNGSQIDLRWSDNGLLRLVEASS